MLIFLRTEYHNQKVMNMSRTRLLLVLTLAFVFVARADDDVFVKSINN